MVFPLLFRLFRISADSARGCANFRADYFICGMG
jgi:hypothetical protein